MSRGSPGRSHQEKSLGDRALGGAVWGTLQTVVLLPVSFIGNVLVARLLGPQDLGVFAALMVFLSVSTPLLDFGFGAALQQWAGRAVAAGDTAGAEALFRKALGFHILVQQPGIILAAAFLLRDSPAAYFWCFAALSLGGACLGSVNYWLVAHNRLALGAKRSIAAGILGNVVLVGVAAAGGSPQLMWLARQAVQLIPAMAVLLALTGRELGTLLRPRLPRNMPDGFWAFARPMWVTVALGALLSTRSEVYLLQWNGLAAAAGVFAVAFGLATQITGLLTGIHTSFGAAAITLSGQSEARLQRALVKGHAMFSVLASLALAAGAGVPHVIPALYGEAYADAAILMPVILMAATLGSSLNTFGVAAVVRRQRRRLLVAQALAVVLDLGLAAALIPAVGVAGAALGAAAGLVGVNAALLVRELGARGAHEVLLRGPWLKACVAACIGYIAGFVSPEPWSAGVLASMIAVGIQVLLLRAFHRASVVELLDWFAGRVPLRVHSLASAILVSGPEDVGSSPPGRQT